MDSKDKKILELTSKFLEKQGCLWGEFDAEGYSYRFYGGRRFQCGTSEKEQGVSMNLPFEIGEVLSKILEERAEDIPEEIDEFGVDGSYGSLSSISVKIYPKERKIMVVGVYQVSITLDEQVGDVYIPDSVVKILKKANITKATVDFNGGGDSGYIEDNLFVGDGEYIGISTIDENGALDNFLYRVLDQYGDWYNNEGASGNIEIDLENNVAIYHVWANDYGYEDEFLFNVDF